MLVQLASILGIESIKLSRYLVLEDSLLPLKLPSAGGLLFDTLEWENQRKEMREKKTRKEGEKGRRKKKARKQETQKA
jgi:hypothetical protein